MAQPATPLPADGMVQLQSSIDTTDLQMKAGMLKSAGIPAMVVHGNAGGLRFAMHADLQVRLEDEAKARAILADIPTLKRVPHLFDQDGEARFCPSCGSERLVDHEGRVPSALMVWPKRVESGQGWYRCLQCGSVHYDGPRKRFESLPVAILWSAALGAATIFFIWFINLLRWL